MKGLIVVFFPQLSSVNFHFWEEDWTPGYVCAHFKIFLKFYPFSSLTPLTANPTKWSNTLKQLVGRCHILIGELHPQIKHKRLKDVIKHNL